jgi:hypothetical protein
MAAGMPWIRLQVGIFRNAKLLSLREEKQYRSIVTYLDGMCYSGEQGYAGYIPKEALRVIGAVKADVDRLVSEGLWSPAPGGWQVNGWEDYQLADEESLARSEKAKKAAAARWAKRNGRSFDEIA